MQRHHANAAPPGFIHAFTHQRLRQAAPAVFRLDEDIQHIAALFSGGIKVVRCPVEEQKAGRSNGAVAILDNPADILVVEKHAPHPWLEVSSHLIQDCVRSTIRIGKHCLAMARDQFCIVNRSSPSFEHDPSIGNSLFASQGLIDPAFFRNLSGPYHSSVRTLSSLRLDTSLLKPGMRVAVGLSGGADSVALLCALVEQGRELGLVLHAAHLHHGLRGAEADADLEFCRNLAAKFDLSFHESRVDTEAEARRVPKSPAAESADVIPADSIEGTARRLRYLWFRKLLAEIPLDAVATAHTLDDQAETVLAKFLRGAWTEGLSGIHPVLEFPEGRVVRPLLHTSRAEVEAFLNARNQPWREDSTNRHLTFTRNRIRHELLPLLTTWNPQLRDHLAQMAELARDEEAWWQSEVARLASRVIVRGRPVRGGGRATTTADGVALDLARLKAEPIALQRRLLRFAAAQLESALDFAATEALRHLTLTGRAGQKLELAGGLRVDRTHREIRLTRSPEPASASSGCKVERYECVIPGEVIAPEFQCRISLEFASGSAPSAGSDGGPKKAILRPWKPGDRVRLRYSSGPRKVKEVLERMKVTGEDRSRWPVLEVAGRIIWMRGVELESDPDVSVSVSDLPPLCG